ncbi:hypothetical protein MRB53_031130 [Persea americana]|uniref:Uncharacterized protein n=1 Tax=Persea americana TaxID=3435 RepID=A0ACC2KN37_PERAE|nr:hypothetical protein MRB53_031130 [Persea americana]
MLMHQRRESSIVGKDAGAGGGGGSCMSGTAGPVPPLVTLFRFWAHRSKRGPDMPVFSMPKLLFLHDFAVANWG